jgi:hypothetical protein
MMTMAMMEAGCCLDDAGEQNRRQAEGVTSAKGPMMTTESVYDDEKAHEQQRHHACLFVHLDHAVFFPHAAVEYSGPVWLQLEIPGFVTLMSMKIDYMMSRCMMNRTMKIQNVRMNGTIVNLMRRMKNCQVIDADDVHVKHYVTEMHASALATLTSAMDLSNPLYHDSMTPVVLEAVLTSDQVQVGPAAVHCD